MPNSPHFLGYSRLGAEITKGAVDYREQFDIATDHVCRWSGPTDPDYYRLWGPSQVGYAPSKYANTHQQPQWPDEACIPGFKADFRRYLDQVTQLSYDFSSLIAEALGLPPDGLSRFYDEPPLMQHRAKIVKYPVVQDHTQGVGPHYDAGFLTFVSMRRSFYLGSNFDHHQFIHAQLLQASPHRGLQVQNLAGDWIDAPPVPGSFVVNFGKGAGARQHDATLI